LLREQKRDPGDGSPQQGPGAEPRWGSGSETHVLNIRLNKIHKNFNAAKINAVLNF